MMGKLLVKVCYFAIIEISVRSKIQSVQNAKYLGMFYFMTDLRVVGICQICSKRRLLTIWLESELVLNSLCFDCR